MALCQLHTWVFNTWFWARPEIVGFAGPDALDGQKPLPTGGLRRGPPVAMGFSPAGAKVDDFQSAQKPYIKNPRDAVSGSVNIYIYMYMHTNIYMGNWRKRRPLRKRNPPWQRKCFISMSPALGDTFGPETGSAKHTDLRIKISVRDLLSFR